MIKKVAVTIGLTVHLIAGSPSVITSARTARKYMHSLTRNAPHCLYFQTSKLLSNLKLANTVGLSTLRFVHDNRVHSEHTYGSGVVCNFHPWDWSLRWNVNC
ncbi:hypothetical protein PF010_g12560 [Phytophthora fragariae]|uniref:Secreted protein n=1 Tax=Phytophthora fragariae TaxID=53985 RepID=A0A6G0L2N5_9STRA|nr:hypothetical protein PF010_g12560 [Phytophthora fragariae]